MNTTKHPVLPNGFDLGSKELAAWLSGQSVATFVDKQRAYFTPEEIQEFEHESSVNGREFNKLAGIKQYVSDLCRKGTEEAVTIVIPGTVGAKMLELQRRQNDDMIDSGYEETEVEVYAIPDADNQTMEFFDGEGNHYPDRSRSLSISEVHKYCGLLNVGRSSNIIKNGEDNIDGDTGEVLTGTHN